METKQIIETAEEKLIHTYNRYQIVLDKGDGVRLYDTDGKEYLDFGAGIAVFALGYNNKEYNDALKAQIDKLIHTSNYFYNEPAVMAAKALTKASGMDRVFFTNSGTESIEGAIKLVRLLKDRKNRFRNYCNASFIPRKKYGSTCSYRQQALSGSFRPYDTGNKVC